MNIRQQRALALPDRLDNSRKVDAALRDLYDYLWMIFDMEDEPRDTASNKIQATHRDGTNLTDTTQPNIEEHLRKIIDLDRFSQVSREDVLRLQKRCEDILKVAETADVKVEDALLESELESWLRQVSIAESGLLSGRICLLAMSEDCQGGQLYSEKAVLIAVNVLRNAIQACIVPAIGIRSSTTSSASSKFFSIQKKAITALMLQCEQLLRVLATVAVGIRLSETVMNTLEMTAFLTIFANNTHSDSLFGAERANFESLRVAAVDMLAQVFLGHPTQRLHILNELLASLEKLPSTKQGFRYSGFPEGGNVHLVSALIMRLIQSGTNNLDCMKRNKGQTILTSRKSDEEEGEMDIVDQAGKSATPRTSKISKRCTRKIHHTAIQELSAIVLPLLHTTKHNATYVINFFVGRAFSTQTRDVSFCNLLSLFVEDFVASLQCPEWPCAELLLRLLLFRMVPLAEGRKTAPWARTLALEFIGLMATAISSLNSVVREAAASDDIHANLEGLVAWEGPFCGSLKFLNQRSSEEPQPSSAVRYLMVQWAFKVCTIYDSTTKIGNDCEGIEEKYGQLASKLSKLISDKGLVSMEHDLDCITDSNGRLSYTLTLLHSQFYGSFERVLSILLASMTSGQATIRSKSLKIILGMVEADPTILDRETIVKALIFRCANDSSVSVRDSALSLVGKCIELRPALEGEMMSFILQHLEDIGITVRKHAIRLCKEIYVQKAKAEARSLIAEALLCRVRDLDGGVRELACQAIEEIWMRPFYPKITSAQFKRAIAEQVALMVKIQRSNGASASLADVLQNILSHSKSRVENLRVCTALITTMFEIVRNKSRTKDDITPSTRATLQLVMVFAEVVARIFTTEQLQLLKPYIANVNVGDDMEIYRCVVTILRYTLPHLTDIKPIFLISVRKDLMLRLPRLSRPILDVVFPCLWAVSEALRDTKPLISLTISCLQNVRKIQNVDPKDPTKEAVAKRQTKLLLLAGMCSTYFNLDAQVDTFRRNITSWKGDSISELTISTFTTFLSPTQPLDVRKAAFDAIGMACNSWPKNFTSIEVYARFEQAFDEKNSTLAVIIMRAFKKFLENEEQHSEAKVAIPRAATSPSEKLGLLCESERDGVASFIAQKFVKGLIRTALATQDGEALLAAEILSSMNLQGLLHPKECAPALIALGTSQNTKIVELSYKTYQLLHEKHRTIIEKEYMPAVQLVYEYQRDVVQDPRGATTNPYTSKLHMMVEVMRLSNNRDRDRKKFYENLCNRIDFDPAKIGSPDLLHYHQQSQFIIENMAFFEYASVEELSSVIVAMEKVFTRAGVVVTHMIDREVFHRTMGQVAARSEQSLSVLPAVDPIRLQELAEFSKTLSRLWRAITYLREQYGIQTTCCDDKTEVTKDLNKVPIKVQGINGESFWENSSIAMTAMNSEETMINQCRTFVELFHTDVRTNIAGIDVNSLPRVRLGTMSDKRANGSGRRKRKAAGIPWVREKRASSAAKAGRRKRRTCDVDDDQNETWI
jgi:cohesin loading factor subunit SCC2